MKYRQAVCQTAQEQPASSILVVFKLDKPARPGVTHNIVQNPTARSSEDGTDVVSGKRSALGGVFDGGRPDVRDSQRA